MYEQINICVLTLYFLHSALVKFQISPAKHNPPAIVRHGLTLHLRPPDPGKPSFTVVCVYAPKFFVDEQWGMVGEAK